MMKNFRKSKHVQCHKKLTKIMMITSFQFRDGTQTLKNSERILLSAKHYSNDDSLILQEKRMFLVISLTEYFLKSVFN